MSESAGGYSINPSSTGVAGLDNYFDAGQKSDSAGVRGATNNISTGRSSLKASTDAGKEGLLVPAIVGATVLIGIYLYKQKT